MNRKTLAAGLLLLIATLVFSPFAILSALLFVLLLSTGVYLLSVVFSPGNGNQPSSSNSASTSQSEPTG